MKTRTAEQFIKSGFVVVYGATADKFSFANAVIETTLDDTDEVNEMFIHNVARTHFGAKEGNSARVTKKAAEIHDQIEVETIMTQVIEDDETAEVAEAEEVAEETVATEEVVETEAEEVAPKAFTGWGMAPPS